jgi:hypothetical protein
MQHFANQEEAKNLGSKDYVNKLDYLVFNWYWNFSKFQFELKTI